MESMKIIIQLREERGQRDAGVPLTTNPSWEVRIYDISSIRVSPGKRKHDDPSNVLMKLKHQFEIIRVQVRNISPPLN